MDYFVDNQNTEKIARILFLNKNSREEGAYDWDVTYFKIFDQNEDEVAIYYEDIDKLIEVLNTIKRFKAEGKI